MRLLRLKLNERFRSLPEGFEVDFIKDFNPDEIELDDGEVLEKWDQIDIEAFYEQRHNRLQQRYYQLNPYCLVGRNGSGKSNVLELLSAIFHNTEVSYLNYVPNDFYTVEETEEGATTIRGFDEERTVPNSFILEYLIPMTYVNSYQLGIGGEISDHLEFAHVRIEKKHKERIKMFWLNGGLNGDGTIDWLDYDDYDENDRNFEFELKPLTRLYVKAFLPKYVIGYSSGENEILSLPFYKMRFVQLDEYRDFLTKQLPYGGVPEGRLVFLDRQFSQAIVLCNFLLQDKKILAPFKEEVGLDHIYEFRLIIRRNRYLDVDEDVLRSLGDKATESNSTRELTDLLEDTINKLRKCSTAHYFDEGTETLYLDYWVNEATQDAFRFHFESALGLFQAFQILLTLNLVSVDEDIKKEVYQSDNLYVSDILPTPADRERVFSFGDFRIQKRGVKELIFSKSLSDGEHQFLHTLGLCLLFKDEPCLFLLDEPETHLNPDWRSRFISRLRDCFSEGKAKEVAREMLITSHSPFIVSDSKQEYVLVFHRDENTGLVSYDRPDFKTFGASVNQITIKLFDKPETIGGYAYQQLQELEERFKVGEDGEKLIKEANQLLGDSVEKIMFIDKILDQLDKQ